MSVMSISWKRARAPPMSKQKPRTESGAAERANGYILGSRSLRLRGGWMAKGGNDVIVVVVVVTTVVWVAGPREKWPSAAMESWSGAGSRPGGDGAEAMRRDQAAMDADQWRQAASAASAAERPDGTPEAAVVVRWFGGSVGWRAEHDLGRMRRGGGRGETGSEEEAEDGRGEKTRGRTRSGEGRRAERRGLQGRRTRRWGRRPEGREQVGWAWQTRSWPRLVFYSWRRPRELCSSMMLRRCDAVLLRCSDAVMLRCCDAATLRRSDGPMVRCSDPAMLRRADGPMPRVLRGRACL